MSSFMSWIFLFCLTRALHGYRTPGIFRQTKLRAFNRRSFPEPMNQEEQLKILRKMNTMRKIQNMLSLYEIETVSTKTGLSTESLKCLPYLNRKLGETLIRTNLRLVLSVAVNHQVFPSFYREHTMFLRN